MAGGDANSDGTINTADQTLWAGEAGTKGYKTTDFDLNTQTDNKDKNNVMVENTDLSTQIPE